MYAINVCNECTLNNYEQWIYVMYVFNEYIKGTLFLLMFMWVAEPSKCV